MLNILRKLKLCYLECRTICQNENRLVDADRLIKQINRLKGFAHNNLDKKIADVYIMALEEVEIVINDLV